MTDTLVDGPHDSLRGLVYEIGPGCNGQTCPEFVAARRVLVSYGLAARDKLRGARDAA